MMKAMCESAEISGFCFQNYMTAHGLRATMTFLLIEMGQDHAIAIIRMGQKDTDTLSWNHNLQTRSSELKTGSKYFKFIFKNLKHAPRFSEKKQKHFQYVTYDVPSASCTGSANKDFNAQPAQPLHNSRSLVENNQELLRNVGENGVQKGKCLRLSMPEQFYL